MTTVELRRLTKRYDDHHAVRGVDLRIEDGELFVIVGPSGCGKTSVLRMVAGLESATSGSVLIDGVRHTVESPACDVAMMFQEPTLYPRMTVRENLRFPLAIAGVRRREVRRRVTETADRLGLTPVLDQYPSRLSGGQQQRVAMGRAMIRTPALVLMDEPMSNLDAKLRTELRGLIARMQQQTGVTTLYVTHDQVEAMSLGHRIAVMRDGLVVQCGPPDELYHDPVDRFVATFIGTPPMNLVRGRIIDDPTGPQLRLGSSVIALGAAWDRRLADVDGSEVVVGLRPQAIRFASEGAITADVHSIEAHGSVRTISATIDAPDVRSGEPARLVIELDAEEAPEVELWRPSRLTVDLDDIHLFDPASGRSLRRPGTQPVDALAAGVGREGRATGSRSANLANTGPTSTVIST
ncbi:MAG: ABC transporter ATP-binding protein [Ilumatobacter sp.]|nr:ABC transporter ATP-binding protein [Ilumatobacter sp.]